MATYKPGDKFVIEIDSVMTNKKGTLYGIKGFSSLVFDEYGLSCLEDYNPAAVEENTYNNIFNLGFKEGSTRMLRCIVEYASEKMTE